MPLDVPVEDLPQQSEPRAPTSPSFRAPNPLETGEKTSPEFSFTTQEWTSQFVGLSGDQDPYVLRHCHFSANRYKRSNWACLRVKGDGTSTPTHFTVVPDEHLDARPPWYPTSPPIDLATSEHQNLIDIYLSTVHASFPLLDPETLQKPASHFNRPLLGAIYQLTRQFRTQPSAANDDLIYQWRVFLFQAMPLEARNPRLDTVEATIHWIQREALIHRAPTTPGLWSEIGSLVGIAHELGLNVDPSSWEIEPAQKSRRIRIAWALFVADKWAALGLGRPSYISRDDWSVPMVTEDDFSSSPDTPESAKLVFIGMAKLSVLLAEVLHKFYTIKAQQTMQSMSQDELMEITMFFEEQLHTFLLNTLTPLKEMVTVGSILDPTGTLELAYHTLQVIIYRAVLRYLPYDTACAIRQRAQLVLVDAVQLLADLRVSRLRAFWWSPTSGTNFALIGSFMFSMLLSSIEEHEVAFWTTLIARYRRLLDLQSVSFNTTKLAARRLDLLATVTETLTEENALNTEEVWSLDI